MVPQNVTERRASKSRQGGKTTQKARVSNCDAAHLGLLEHHLGNEDRVGVARPAPREVAPVPAIPGAQQAAEGRFASRGVVQLAHRTVRPAKC